MHTVRSDRFSRVVGIGDVCEANKVGHCGFFRLTLSPNDAPRRAERPKIEDPAMANRTVLLPLPDYYTNP